MPNPVREHVLVAAPRMSPDGAVPVPTAPGLGVEVDVDVLRESAAEA